MKPQALTHRGTRRATFEETMTDPFSSSSGAPFAHRSLVDRAIGAARLDIPTYEEVEADRSATGQAAVVVAVAAVCSAIGSIGEGTPGVIGALIGGIIGWLVWSGVTYLIGTMLFGGTADWGELLRTLGFAQAPGVFYVLGIIPFLGVLVKLAVAIWVLVAGIIAIRQALDVSTGKAVLTAIVGWLALLIPMMMLGGVAAIMMGGR
ncbi:MAG TPA: YIP1 family protein [Longimicrobium sp.]|nr:YIP1 family protein [Longimicrobium sp.]